MKDWPNLTQLLGHSEDIKTNSDIGGSQCVYLRVNLHGTGEHWYFHFAAGGHWYCMRQNLFLDGCYRTDR